MPTKKKSNGNTLAFFINIIVVVILCIGYLLPYLSPIKTPILAVISLAFPIFYILNLLFLIYWLIKLKKKLILSLLTFIIGFSYLNDLYKLSGKKVLLKDDISVMSYNVRLLNYYNANKDKTTGEKAVNFIHQKKPDILVMQEYTNDNEYKFEYPHKYFKTKSRNNIFGLAIFSKYPILNSGSLDLESSANNIVFTDLKINNDTVRVYNIHLESLRINPNKENFGEKDSEKLVSRLKSTFKTQAKQVEAFIAHQEEWKGKQIICGDFNNTAFSWVYHQISKGKIDAFEEAGKGLGKTYDYAFPLRIDFILTDENAIVNNFKTFPVKYSDHFPIMARLNFDNQ